MKLYGAKWWKFDFHAHTPASFDYGKEESNLKETTPREWLLNVMNKEIDCIAITDHNSGEWIDKLKFELEKMKGEKCEGYRDLYLFPGIEITVHGGIHLLGIFNIDKGSSDIAELIGSIEYNGTRGNSDGCTIKSFEHVVEEIIRRGGIAIPAHVDLERGIFKEEEGNTLRNCIQSKGILALEVHNKEYNKPQIYKDLKINHSEIIGSDSHKPQDIGRYFTWIKMEEPCLDALWLALHDGRDGVLRYDDIENEPNDITNRFFIKKILIKNGAKIGLGNEFNVEFSPWMSTIIGGRGSGKSSILNFIRLALDKRNELTDSLKKEFNEFAKVSEGRHKSGMLRKNTEIRIELFKDGRDIAIVWKNDGVHEEHFDVIKDEWITIGNAVDLEQRFPIRIFSQKELYEITKDPKLILNLIDDQINKSDIDSDLEKLKEEWKESKYRENKYKKEITNKESLQIRLDDIKAKMKVFEESDYSHVIQEYKDSKSVEFNLNSLNVTFKENIKTLKDLSSNIKELTISDHINEHLDKESKTILLKSVEDLNKRFKVLLKEAENICLEKNSLYFEIDKLPWNKKKLDIEKKYKDLVDIVGNDSFIDVNLYGKLVEEKSDLENNLDEIKEIETLYLKQVNKSEYIKNKILNIHISIREKRLSLINEWNRRDLGIKINLEIMGDIVNAENEFRQIIRKTDTTFRKDICEIDEDGNIKSGFIYDICNMHRKNKDVEGVIKNVTEKIHSLCDIKNNIYENYSKNFHKHMAKLYDNNSDDISNLMVWIPEDSVKLSIVDGGRQIEVEQGSAGQRTAAVLALILSLDDKPLIIDQPEDDLDTKRISDLVVKGIRRFKLKQQVIIVTHNPNIPVNGASEQVIQLGFINGQINKRISGALQKKCVRESICDVMEGGKVALNNRYHRILKALE